MPSRRWWTPTCLGWRCPRATNRGGGRSTERAAGPGGRVSRATSCANGGFRDELGARLALSVPAPSPAVKPNRFTRRRSGCLLRPRGYRARGGTSWLPRVAPPRGRAVEARVNFVPWITCSSRWGLTRSHRGRVLSRRPPAIRYSVTVLTSGRALRRKKARQPGSLRTAQQTPRLPHRCSSARTRWTITCARSTESSGSAGGESFRRCCVRSTNSAGGGQRVGRVAGIELSTCTAQNIAARVRSDSSLLSVTTFPRSARGCRSDREADPSGCPPGPLA